MELTWLDPDRPDRRDLAGAVAVLEAARAVDSPGRPGATVSAFTTRLRHGWEANPPLAAVARDGRGRITGVLTVSLPHWDNTHLGSVGVTVDPVVRRRGLGRRLFAAGVERVAAQGRRLVLATCFDGTAGVEFLKGLGFDRALEEVHRRQDVRTVDRDRLDREFAAARDRAAGYELVRLPGAVPDELLPGVVGLNEAINDAPTDELDLEDEVFSPRRVRAYEAAQAAYGLRLYRLAARETATGVLAGNTVVAVDGERPWQGYQHDTSVVRQHRGRRLGLLLKIGMLRWLAEQEPQLRALDTGNAASNAHMIAINELLGYRIIARTIEWQRAVGDA